MLDEHVLHAFLEEVVAARLTPEILAALEGELAADPAAAAYLTGAGVARAGGGPMPAPLRSRLRALLLEELDRAAP